MLLKALFLSAFAVAVGTTAHAATAIDNLSFVGNPTGVQPGYTSGSAIGQSFLTGSTALSVNDVVFPQIVGSSDAFTSTETFNLFTNNPTTNLPLAAVGNFTLGNDTTLVFGQPGFGQTAAIPTAATMLLAPNTRYWLVLGDSTNNAWEYIPSTFYSSGFGVTLPSTNTSYKTTSAGATTTYALSSGPQQFFLDVNAVPEPSTYCLMAVAGLALVVSRKRSLKVS